ncbi:flagellar biosynthesis protein FlhF [Azovibrio restrictus]|uniref:flagellar biosynthesis protein FlhF n=1 Tax=Azovibrio restrictus TaxID=146938 RepID=UPI0026F16057|nr:flagellar biosynthesis protein FlhF [Azovibrio restrictus]MDD3481915.1 flagellar biosynthesis protein FlhF [Azovibrio restrictus]
MNVRKFIAVNAREALRKVKETLGPDAIILSNRGVPGGVEIMAVAARDMAMIVPPVEERPVQRPPRPAPQLADEDDYRVSLSRPAAPAAQPAVAAQLFNAPLRQNTPAPAVAPRAAAAPVQQQVPVNASIPKPASLRQAAEPARPAAPPRTPAGPAPTVSSRHHPQGRGEAEVVPAAVMDEIRSLRKIVEQHLAGFAWGEVARTEPVKTEVLRQMLDAGFSPQFARELLLDLPPEMDTVQALAWTRGVADRSLHTLGADNDIIDKGGIYALMGPTGVGKTTTTAKLAARCVLRHGASKVALVTTDSYRIGAHEQLRIYGRILGVTVYLAKDAEELHQILTELKQKHMVLIDTMGMSQKDKLVVELNAMLSDCAVRRLLVLSATSRGDTLDDVVRAYRGDDLAGCILTKVDETASLAPALDAIMRHGLRLHYVSNGQRVPEDLHLPNRAYLLHRAFKEVPDAAHRYDGVEPGLMMANAGLMAAGGRRG